MLNRPYRADTVRLAAIVASGLLFTLATPHRAAAARYDLYGVQAASVELPSIYGLLRRPGDTTTDALNLTSNLDSSFVASLDTGTGGLVLSKEEATTLGVLPETVSGSTATFSDSAGTGSVSYNISEPLNLQLANYTAAGLPTTTLSNSAVNSLFSQSTLNTRFQVAQTPDPYTASDPLNVIGTPAIAGKVTVIDARLDNHLTGYDASGNPLYSGLTGLTDLPTNPSLAPLPQVQTFVYNPGTADASKTSLYNPGIPAASQTVKLSYANLSGFSVTNPTAGVTDPTLAHNPFIGPAPLTVGATSPAGITLSRTISGSTTPATVTGSWMFDTGSQISFMSSAEALALGVKLTYAAGIPTLTDVKTGLAPAGEFSVPITDSTGTTSTLLGFTVPELDLPTTTGVIAFHNVPIGVQDVTLSNGTSSFTLAGDFGMNLLLPSTDINYTTSGIGNFDFVTYDDSAGTLQLTDSLVASVPEPTSIALLGAAVLICRRSRSRAL